MKTSKITVLVALYKAGEHIAGKLRDLQNQTFFHEAEIVLLNCQNLHNERAEYAEFAKQLNVTVIEYDKHVNLYDTWNDGIMATSSDYIVNANVDDRWHPEYLEKLSKYLDDDCGAGVVSSYTHVTDRANCTWPWEPISDLCIKYPGGTAGPCPMWRRSLHMYGMFGSYAVIGDARMWEIWASCGVRFAVIPEYLALYYLSPTSLERRIGEDGKPIIDAEKAAPYAGPTSTK